MNGAAACRQGRADHRRRPGNGCGARAGARARGSQGGRLPTSPPKPGERSPPSCVTAAGEASYHDHDVTDPGAWRDLVAAVEQMHGPIDVLVNNAGVQVRSAGIEADDEEWARVTGVNQRGVFLGMRAVIPGMVEKRRGSIVNVASVAALVGLRGSIPYQGSKAAVLGLTRGAAVTYGRDNIRVNAICPGLVVTGMTESASPAAVAAMKAQIPLRSRRSARGDLGGRRVPCLGRIVLHHRRRAADRRRIRRRLAAVRTRTDRETELAAAAHIERREFFDAEEVDVDQRWVAQGAPRGEYAERLFAPAADGRSTPRCSPGGWCPRAARSAADLRRRPARTRPRSVRG